MAADIWPRAARRARTGRVALDRRPRPHPAIEHDVQPGNGDDDLDLALSHLEPSPRRRRPARKRRPGRRRRPRLRTLRRRRHRRVYPRVDVDGSRQRLATRDVADEHPSQEHERDVAPANSAVGPASTLPFTGSAAFPLVIVAVASSGAASALLVRTRGASRAECSGGEDEQQTDDRADDEVDTHRREPAPPASAFAARYQGCSDRHRDRYSERDPGQDRRRAAHD